MVWAAGWGQEVGEDGLTESKFSDLPGGRQAEGGWVGV